MPSLQSSKPIGELLDFLAQREPSVNADYRINDKTVMVGHHLDSSLSTAIAAIAMTTMVATHRRLFFERLESRRLLAAVDIPKDLVGFPGGQVQTPVNTDNAAGIRGAEIRLSYDPSYLDLTATDVVAGSVWSAMSNDVQLEANIDRETGLVVIFVYVPEELGVESGSLVELGFTVRAETPVGTTTVVDLARVRLNEGAIGVEPAPQPGLDPTDGLITVAAPEGSSSVSGCVYADTNNNLQPDAMEGVPGVTIVLVHQTSGAELQTTTDDSGGYEFAKVPAGTYMIRQRQPAAYLDGGSNEIAAVLSAGQNLTGQNFRELGLRPEFVINRLFSTAALPVGSAGWRDAIQRINVEAEGQVAGTAPVSTPSTPVNLWRESSSTERLSNGEASQLRVLPTLGIGEAVGAVPRDGAATSGAEGESPLPSTSMWMVPAQPVAPPAEITPKIAATTTFAGRLVSSPSEVPACSTPPTYHALSVPCVPVWSGNDTPPSGTGTMQRNDMELLAYGAVARQDRTDDYGALDSVLADTDFWLIVC